MDTFAERFRATRQQIERYFEQYLMPEQLNNGMIRISGDGLNALNTHRRECNKVKNAEFEAFFAEKILEDENLCEEGRQNAEKMLKNAQNRIIESIMN